MPQPASPRTRVGRKPAGGRPTLEASAALADVILDAAWGLLLKKGYKELNIDAVARSASASKRTIYDRFSSKDGLFEALVDRASSRWRADVVQALQRHEGPRGLHALTSQILRLMVNPDVQFLMTVIVLEARSNAHIARLKRQLEETPAQGLAEHFAITVEGYPEAADGLRLAASIFALIAAWGRLATSSLAEPASEMEDRLCREVRALLDLYGCGAYRAPAPPTGDALVQRI